MTIFCWNCRGFGEADDPTIPYLHQSVLKHHPLILFLQETHTSVDIAAMKTHHLGFPNYFGVDSNGRSGGLLLYWGRFVDIQVIGSCPRFVFCKMGIDVNQGVFSDMYIMFLYGDPVFQYRSGLWDRISNEISGFSPFLVIGDFNQVDLHSDKFGGSLTIRGQADFIEWKLKNNLVDIPFFGPRFTWTNGQLDESCIMERLDRAYATQDWLDLFPSTSVLHLPILVSDHSPIMLRFLPQPRSRKRPYRLDNWCLQLPEVIDLVSNAWNTPVHGSTSYVLSRKLAAVRFAILNWIIHHRICYGVNWSSIETELLSASTFICDTDAAISYHNLRASNLQLISKQHSYWFQRIKTRKECLEGLPTRFLFNRVKQRSSKQRLISLRTSDGTWINDPTEIEAEILTYFRLIMGTNHSTQAQNFQLTEDFLSDLDIPSLSSDDCSILSTPFNETDVLRVIRSMDGSKSPGPDGITPRFYQLFWPQIGHVVTAAILQFLNSGVMLKEWNHTHIILIPKVAHPEMVTQYRPISLCNVIYRIASKCLANRLKLVISSIVSDSQQAFVPGRLMTDSCIIAHEVLHYINKTKKGTNCYAVLKLDMNKAFDRVSWTFLMLVMKRMGFPTFWQNIIWECIATVSYRVLINGEPSDSFRAFCGLRQGDPLSPYLFIMCMEVLSRQVIRAEKIGSLTGIKISRYAPTLSHLLYADDALLCCKATPLAFETLRDLFKEFETASGQMINLSKSFIKFTLILLIFCEHPTSILKMTHFPSFGTYLGVPIDIPRRRSELFLPFIDCMTTRIASWSALHLSQPNKLIIISAILLASLNHLFSVVPIPSCVSRKIDALLAAFWWRNDWNKHSIHWTSQSVLQAPKEYGGLGFRNSHILSQALLLKNFWRIHSQPTAILARYMVPKYARDLPIPLATSRVSQPSFIWAGICKAVSSAKTGISWKLGKGNLVDIWSSCWINGNLPSPTVPIPNPLPSLSEFLLPSGDWNPFMVFRYFSSSCAKKIVAMEPPDQNFDDFLYWKYTEDGTYSVKSGYSILWAASPAAQCIRSFVHTFPWKHVWRQGIPPKISVMLWRLAHNIMPTNDNLLSKRVPVESVCQLCRNSPETEEHLFRSCEIAQHVWKASALGINSIANPSTPFISWIADFVVYLHRQSLASAKYWLLLCFCCVFQAIWTARNSVLFREDIVNPSSICQLLDHLLHSLHRASEVRPAQVHTNYGILMPSVALGPSISQRERILISVSAHHIPKTNCFTCCIQSSDLDYSDSSEVQALTLFEASTRALLRAMRYAHSVVSTSVSFQVTCGKLSAVLANSLPVPISVRNSIREIRTLFVIYPYWSVSLATG
ncbi:uncharacterized protein LOC141639712 [Silene latifolia]|uniref:uncharacterized protein LOC141639712 n=1 Tax=Silene latifolia TaxID=37657 RepID=UPI003D772B6A